LMNGNEKGGGKLGQTIKPDEFVYEESDEGPLLDALSATLEIIEWKATTVELGSDEKGQAVYEGQYFLMKTGRPFVFVVLSNFIHFMFFKVEHDPVDQTFTYSQSQLFVDTAVGFAHFHNLLSQDAKYLGSDFLPTIPGIKVGGLVGRGATGV